MASIKHYLTAATICFNCSIVVLSSASAWARRASCQGRN